MRVVNLVSQPQWRGAETFALDFRTSLLEAGHWSVNVYLYQPPIRNSFPLLPGDVSLGFSSTHTLEKVIGFNPALLLALFRTLKKLDPDFIQLHGDRTNKYAALLKLFRMTRAKVVARIIGDPSAWLKGRHRVSIARRLYRYMDGFIAVTNQAARNFSTLIQPAHDVRTIMNGLDVKKLDRSASTPLARNGFTVLFVGALDRNKRPDVFVDVIAKLNSDATSPVFGWIVGDGPERHAVEDRVRQQGLERYITIFGYSTQMKGYYEGADVLLMTSESEGLPAVVLEASYFQRPVVANLVGGLPECVIDGETGFLVKDNDLEYYASVIRRLHSDEELRKRLGASGRAMVLQRFEISGITNEYLLYYESLARAHAN